jgi:anti-sigma factor (TIGR02949 family)
MNCDDVRRQLGPYLDGELDRAAIDALEAHLPGCATCRAELRSLETLRAALRSVPREPAPQDLRLRILKAAPEAPIGSAPHRGAWAMAAMLMLGAMLGVLAASLWTMRVDGGAGADRLLARDLVSSHLRAVAATSPVDVLSEDRHTVKPWFSGRIGESPPVVDPHSEEFPLLGGRVDYVGERRTAVVVYGHRKHVIDVFVVPPGEARATAVTLQGYSIVPCRLEGQSTWIVSDVDAESVRRFRELLGCIAD